MQLTLFKYCQEQQRDLAELPIRLAWADTPPQIGQAVGMGRERRWQVVQVHTFTPEAEVEIAAVHLALIALPEDNSDQTQWDCWRYRHLVPLENIHIQLEEVGLPELGLGFNCLNEPPTPGQRLFDGAPTGEGTKLRALLRPWQIERYDSYLPSHRGCPYTAVHLSWCRAISNGLVTV